MDRSGSNQGCCPAPYDPSARRHEMRPCDHDPCLRGPSWLDHMRAANRHAWRAVIVLSACLALVWLRAEG